MKTSPGFEEGLRKCSIEVERRREPVIFSKVLKDIKAGYTCDSSTWEVRQEDEEEFRPLLATQ